MTSKPLQKQQNVEGFKIITHNQKNQVTPTEYGIHAVTRTDRNRKKIKPFEKNHLRTEVKQPDIVLC